jgi:SAM-dependent methyltransferase
VLRIDSAIVSGLVSRAERAGAGSGVGGSRSGTEPDAGDTRPMPAPVSEAPADAVGGARPAGDAESAAAAAGRLDREGRQDPGGAPDGNRGERPDWQAWLDSPPGRYILEWEQSHFDEAVADVFGYHAIQCGAPGVDALRANRMPHRVHAVRGADPLPAHDRPRVRVEHFEELPFGTQSVDLLVLPHVLEFAHDPHAVLREADRVLRPEGRLIVSGFNPVSLWGARQMLRGPFAPFLPREGHFIAVPRLRDWCKLLSFEVERARYGCWRPPCVTQLWLDRTRFLESAGDRWWPICGAVYMVSATKRVHAMRLIGRAWTRSGSARSIALPTAQRRGLGDEGPG